MGIFNATTYTNDSVSNYKQIKTLLFSLQRNVIAVCVKLYYYLEKDDLRTKFTTESMASIDSILFMS